MYAIRSYYVSSSGLADQQFQRAFENLLEARSRGAFEGLEGLARQVLLVPQVDERRKGVVVGEAGGGR